MYQPPPEAPEYPPPPQPPRFPSRQEKARQAAQSQPSMEASVAPSELDIKPDVKPPRRLATSYLGPPGLLRMLGAGDEDHIITKVLPGTDPLQDFEEDDPSQTIVIDYETDASSDVDDLSEVSMTSAWRDQQAGVSGAPLRYCSTVSANGSFHRCPSYQG